MAARTKRTTRKYTHIVTHPQGQRLEAAKGFKDGWTYAIKVEDSHWIRQNPYVIVTMVTAEPIPDAKIGMEIIAVNKADSNWFGNWKIVGMVEGHGETARLVAGKLPRDRKDMVPRLWVAVPYVPPAEPEKDSEPEKQPEPVAS